MSRNNRNAQLAVSPTLNIQSPTPTPTTSRNGSMESLLRQLEEMRTENARLAAVASAPRQGRLALKVTDKGGLSVYGLGRFPVTLYREQWMSLTSPEVVTVLRAEAEKLPTKAQNVAAGPAVSVK